MLGFIGGFFAGIIITAAAVWVCSSTRQMRRIIEALTDGRPVGLDVLKERKAFVRMPEVAELARKVAGYNKNNRDVNIEDVL